MHRWWRINYWLSISYILWTGIFRRRHIWIIMPWRTEIMHVKVIFPWHMHWWSMWRKRHLCRKITSLPILIMELLSRRRFWAFGIFDCLAPLTLLCLRDLARSFSLLFEFNGKTPISGFLGLTIFGFDLFCETLDEAVRPVWTPVRLVAVQPALLPMFCCPPPWASKH
jgi:hypothetical protein